MIITPLFKKAIADFANGGPRIFEQDGHKYYFVREGERAIVYKDRDPEAPKQRYTVPGSAWDFACW